MPKHDEIRLYNELLPKKDELIIVTIKSFDKNIGFYVTMDEYNNKEALLNISQSINGRARKNITSIVPINSKQVVYVMDVSDEEVDVSRKNINKTEQTKLLTYFSQVKRLRTAMKKLSYFSGTDLTDLYENIVWPNFSKNYSDEKSIDCYPMDTVLRNPEKLEIPDKYKQILMQYHLKVFGPVVYTDINKFMLVSYQNDGCKQISNILSRFVSIKKHTKNDLGKDPEKFNIIIRPIALPKYEIEIISTSQQTNKLQLENFVVNIEDEFETTGFFLMDKS